MLDRIGTGLGSGAGRERAQDDAPRAQDVSPRALYQHFRVRVVSWDRTSIQRIQVSSARPPRQWCYFTIQDADYLIGQLQRAIRRAPRAR